MPLVGVQHHHAHIVSCMAENGVTAPVIGIALDGSGYGPDGTVWGGEFMVAGPDGYERACRLEPLPLPGGELGIRKPYRLAIAYLHRLLGRVPELPFLEGVSPDERRVVVEQVDKGFNTPLTSSCGRLFDAISALLGIRGAVTFEGAGGDRVGDAFPAGWGPLRLTRFGSTSRIRVCGRSGWHRYSRRSWMI